jgi:hypothetical protein
MSQIHMGDTLLRVGYTNLETYFKVQVKSKDLRSKSEQRTKAIDPFLPSWAQSTIAWLRGDRSSLLLEE